MSSLGPWSGSRGAFDPFSFDVWDPLAGLGSWISDIGGARRGGGDDAVALARANVDWRETSNAHIFTAEIPGVRKEEVKVAVEEGNILQISGERSNEEEEKGDTWHRVERRRGRFMRRFRLPDNAKMEGIKCKMENGVLTVEIPKQEAAARNIRAIDIS